MMNFLLWSIASAAMFVDVAPVVDQAVMIEITQEGTPSTGVTVRGILHPGLTNEREVAIGVTDARGRIRWTPASAGRVRLSAGEDTLDIYVSGSHPIDGAIAIGMAATAGLTLIGLGWRRRRPRI